MRVSVKELEMLGVRPEAGAEFASDHLEVKPGRFRVLDVVGRWADVKLLAWCTAEELAGQRAAAPAA